MTAPVLTEWELRILRHLAEGDTREKTARYLAVDRKTVGLSINAIYDKLGARADTHAVYLACQHGFLPMPEPDERGEVWTECTR